MYCADGSECWTPTCCASGTPCLKVTSRQPEPEPPQPFTIDLHQSEWTIIDEERKTR